MNLETLYIQIEAETSKIKSQMASVNNQVSNVSKEASKANKSLSTMGKAVIAAFSIRALVGFFNKFLEITKQTESFKKALAEAFDPIVLMIQPALTAMITGIAKAIAWISGVIQAMTGWTGATKKQTAAAQAQKRAYAGFDELNVVPSDSGAANPAVEPLIDTNKYIDMGKAAWEKYGDTVKNILKAIGVLLGVWLVSKLITIGKLLGSTLGAYVMKSWRAVWDATKAGVEELTTVLSKVMWFFKTMDIGKLALIGVGIAIIIAAFVELWTTSERFRKVIMTIVDIIKGMVFVVFGTLAVWIGILFELIGRIAEALYELYQNSLKPVVEVFFYLAGAIATLMAGAFGTVLLITINLIGGALAFVLGMVLAVVEVFNSLFKAIAEGNPWAIALGGILLGIVAPAILAATTALWGMVSALAATTLALIKQIIQWGLQAVATIASSVATAVMTAATWLLNTAFWANPITWVIAGIVALIAIFVWAYQEFEVFRNGVNGVWEGIKQGFKGLVNFVIDGINAMITALNGFKFNIPKWVPVIGGKDFSLNIPLIPRLAQGGMVDPGSLFVAGEAGAELIGSHKGQTTVMPLQNTDFTAAMGQAVYGAMVDAMSSQGSNSITLTIDGMVLAKATETNLNKLSTIQGGLKIAL